MGKKGKSRVKRNLDLQCYETDKEVFDCDNKTCDDINTTTTKKTCLDDSVDTTHSTDHTGDLCNNLTNSPSSPGLSITQQDPPYTSCSKPLSSPVSPLASYSPLPNKDKPENDDDDDDDDDFCPPENQEPDDKLSLSASYPSPPIKDEPENDDDDFCPPENQEPDDDSSLLASYSPPPPLIGPSNDNVDFCPPGTREPDDNLSPPGAPKKPNNSDCEHKIEVISECKDKDMGGNECGNEDTTNNRDYKLIPVNKNDGIIYGFIKPTLIIAGDIGQAGTNDYRQLLYALFDPKFLESGVFTKLGCTDSTASVKRIDVYIAGLYANGKECSELGIGFNNGCTDHEFTQLFLKHNNRLDGLACYSVTIKNNNKITIV